MRVLVITDMEGASGISDLRQTVPWWDKEKWESGCEAYTGDANAAIRGLRKGGAKDICFMIGHQGILVDKLEPGVEVMWERDLFDVTDPGGPRMVGHWDAMMIIGMHAMAGTRDGFMSHTNSQLTALRINGQFVGECEEFAWLVGHHGVPTIMVAGDDAAIREANALLPGVDGVVVKKSVDRSQADCLPLDEAWSLIEEGAARALGNLGAHKAYHTSEPVHVEIVAGSPELAGWWFRMPGVCRLDDRTASFTTATFYEAYQTYQIALGLMYHSYSGGLIERLLKIPGAEEIHSEYRIGRFHRQILVDEPPFPVVKY